MTPQALGLLMLESDPVYRRIVSGDREGLVTAALRDGADLAADVRLRWGDDPEVIAVQLGIPVIDSDDDEGYGSTIVFAEYQARQRRIVLYRRAIARLQTVVDRDARLSLACRVRSVLLAHELYHHFDCTGARPPIARRHRVTVLALGRWRWTSGIASLAEIAAGAFAQSLLQLPVHPKHLDLLMSTPAEAVATTP